ncbi:MAG: ribonuclease III [Acidobacteriota bacterium]
MRGRGLAALEARLGYRFRDRSLLQRALTHSSYANEKKAGADNEALEFLGDAALGFLVAELLLDRFPGMDEGGLSKLKAYLVSRSNLAAAARRLGIGSQLRLGRTLARGEGRRRSSILGNALEAVIAAVHLDGGDAPARAFVASLFGEQLASLDRLTVEGKDHKTALQEALQASGRAAPRYSVEATEGPPHRPTFHVALSVGGEVLGRGRGRNKKEAAQRAARQALRRLGRASGAA